MLERTTCLLLLLAITAGCDDRRGTPEDAGPPDAAPPSEDASPPDAATPDAGPVACADALAERTVAIDPEGPDTQIHPVVRWDGEALWVVYVRPEPGGGDFDVWATRLGCDGAPRVAPFLVQESPEGNDIDPELVVSGDRVLVAWQTDDGTGGTDNLQIRYRVLDRDGAPVSGDRVLRTVRAGEPVTDNHMMPKLAVAPDGGFLVAGIRASDVGRFAVFVQPLDRDGALVGEALEPGPEAMITQSAPSIAVAADGAIWLAYDRAPDEGATEVWLWETTGAPALALEGLTGASGADLVAIDGGVYLAFAGETPAGNDLRLLQVGGAEAALVGVPRRTETAPRWAPAPDGRLGLAYFRQVRGFTMELLVAPVTAGDPPEAGEEQLVHDAAPAYQPALTHVEGDYWFASWAEGASPAFRLRGAFLRL